MWVKPLRQHLIGSSAQRLQLLLAQHVVQLHETVFAKEGNLFFAQGIMRYCGHQRASGSDVFRIV
jgi:hypothetical protein